MSATFEKQKKNKKKGATTTSELRVCTNRGIILKIIATDRPKLVNTHTAELEIVYAYLDSIRQAVFFLDV